MRRLAQFILMLILVSQPGCSEAEVETPKKKTVAEKKAALLALPPEKDWCGGHGLPESKCTKCNPFLIADFKASGDWCPEHSYPESACPICNPQPKPGQKSAQAPAGSAEPHDEAQHAPSDEAAPPPETSPGEAPPPTKKTPSLEGDHAKEDEGLGELALEDRIVRFRSPDIEEAAGIRTVRATASKTASHVECTAQIAFDRNKLADIRAAVPGIVRRLEVQLGQEVKKGDALFQLESTRVGEIQARLDAAKERVRTAKAELERQKSLHESEITSVRSLDLAKRELASAQAEWRGAKAMLRVAGAQGSSTSGRYTLRAPIAGQLVRRSGVVGMLATEDTSLATIADTSVMWALCEVPEVDASRIALGQTVLVSVEGSREANFKGQLTWIAAEVDPRTRTVTARTELANPNGLLRANQFARARVQTGPLRSALIVPRSAIQRAEGRELIFVRTEAGVYQPRIVKRHGDGELVTVEGKLKEGDEIVTSGAILLKTELLPGSIGAGCCEAEGPGGD